MSRYLVVCAYVYNLAEYRQNCQNLEILLPGILIFLMETLKNPSVLVSYDH